MDQIRWKLAKAGATIAAGFIAERVISAAWKGVTGHKPPADPEDPSNRLGEAIAFAVISGAIVSVVRVLATRGAGQAYLKAVGGPAPWETHDDDLQEA